MNVRVSFTMPMPQGITVTMLGTLLSRLLGNVTNLQVVEDRVCAIRINNRPLDPKAAEKALSRSLRRCPRNLNDH